MATPKATTLQQKFGFADKDLTTPAHDALMIWCNDHVRDIINHVWTNRKWPQRVLQDLQESIDKSIKNRLDLEKFRSHILREELNKAQNKYPAIPRGYFDGIYILERNHPVISGQIEKLVLSRVLQQEQYNKWYQEHFNRNCLPPYPEYSISSVKWESPITTGKNFIVGFVDIVIECRDHDLEVGNIDDPLNPEIVITKGRPKQLLIEVKSTIPSAGELIRQIRMYQEYTEPSYDDSIQWLVASPDDRWANLLNTQGIKYFKIPPVCAPDNGTILDFEG